MRSHALRSRQAPVGPEALGLLCQGCLWALRSGPRGRENSSVLADLRIALHIQAGGGGGATHDLSAQGVLVARFGTQGFIGGARFVEAAGVSQRSFAKSTRLGPTPL